MDKVTIVFLNNSPNLEYPSNWGIEYGQYEINKTWLWGFIYLFYHTWQEREKSKPCSTTERPKEMDIVSDPRGSLQNMILVTKKIVERERERARERGNKQKKSSKPTKTLNLKWPPLIINTLKYFTLNILYVFANVYSIMKPIYLCCGGLQSIST